MIHKKTLLAALLMASLGAVASAQELGKGGGPVQGAAKAEGGGGNTKQLERCDQKLGTLAVVEPQDFIMKSLSQYSLPSPTQMIRVVIQQSGCFAVVERGVGMQNLMQERSLADGGQLRSNQNVGKGQMVTADYVMTPDVAFQNNNAGGIGGAIGGLFGPIGAAIGGALKFKNAQVTLTVADTRSGLQVGAATGASESTDFGLGGVLGAAGGLGLGAYENTSEGKVVAGAFVDAYNQMVRSVRNNPDLVRDNASLSVGKAGASVKANAAAAGDVATAKIANIPVYAKQDKKKVAFKLGKDEQVVILGEANGMLEVQGGGGSGWADGRLFNR